MAILPIVTTTPVTGDYSALSGDQVEAPHSGASTADYNSFWGEGNVISDWAYNKDTFAHNEALAATQREQDYNAKEAAKQRAYEEYMSNTAFQRKVADYQKAGFSPLAALEGAVGASTPSGVAASSTGKAAARGSNNFGGLVAAMITAVAMAVSKGVSAAAANKTASAVEASKQALLDGKHLADMNLEEYRLLNKIHLEEAKKALGHASYRVPMSR